MPNDVGYLENDMLFKKSKLKSQEWPNNTSFGGIAIWLIIICNCVHILIVTLANLAFLRPRGGRSLHLIDYVFQAVSSNRWSVSLNWQVDSVFRRCSAGWCRHESTPAAILRSEVKYHCDMPWIKSICEQTVCTLESSRSKNGEKKELGWQWPGKLPGDPVSDPNLPMETDQVSDFVVA